jgi:hypothetical protein
MAELFLAKDTRADRLVVLKRILPHLADEPEFVRMFLDEARIAASLHHPNVVEVHELGQLNGSLFIAMEWVDGIDLRKVLAKEQERGGVVPPGVAAWLVARLCEGLHYAHVRVGPDGKRIGIIHRDISPQNVMVSFQADVKLVDFGIAKATAWMGRSQPGVIKGKFLYLSPEQLSQDQVDHRADLFALGTLLYELTTGKSPFYRGSTEAVIYAIKVEDAPPPQTVRSGYPASLSKVVMKCLRRDRAQRYQTAEDVRLALEDAMRVEAPTTRGDVMRYVAGLFGGDGERTSLYIPPNASSSSASRTGDARLPRGGAPARSEPPGRGAVTSDAVPAVTAPAGRASRGPEGKRPTAAVRPMPQVPEDGVVTAPVSNRARQEDEAGAGVARGAPPVARSGQYAAAGSGDDEATAIGPSRTERGPAAPALPWASGASEPSLQPLDPELGKAWPPQRPTRDEIFDLSDLSVVSVGESTQAAAPPAETREDEVELPEITGPSTLEPVPLRPAARAPAVKRPVPHPERPAARRPPAHPSPGARSSGDREDDIDTVDMANGAPAQTASLRSPEGARRSLPSLAVLAVGALLAVALIVWVLWPAPDERLRPAEPRAPAVEPATAEAPPAAAPPVVLDTVPLRLIAPDGTSLSIDGAATQPGAALALAPGRHQVEFRCPPRKKKKSGLQQLTFEVRAGDGEQVVELPCR